MTQYGARRSGNFRFEGPNGESTPPSKRSHERMVARYARRQRFRRRFLVLLAGAVPIVVAVAAAVVFWPDARKAPAAVPEARPVQAVDPVATGTPLKVTTVDGDTYEFAGVKAGMNGRHPYAEYVVRNPTAAEVLFATPVDLFVRIGQIPKGTKYRPTDGVEGAYTVPGKARLLGPVGGTWKLRKEGGDWYMPPGSSYLIRISSTVPMKQNTQVGDISLWLYELRYYKDRSGRSVPFPK